MGGKYSKEEIESNKKILKKELGILLDEKYYDKFNGNGKLDWQTKMCENNQSIDKYMNSKFTTTTNMRNKIYIQPLPYKKDNFDYKILIEYISIFFQLETILLDPIEIYLISDDKRDNDGIIQYSTTKIRQLLKTNLPNNACCLLAITNADLHPKEKKIQFVFGESSYYDRVGVISYLRFDKMFNNPLLKQCVHEIGLEVKKLENCNNLTKKMIYKKEMYAEALKDIKIELNSEESIINRVLKLVTHEILHMFSFDHCILYNCNMCGIMGNVQLDNFSYTLCPICIQKLYFAKPFDIKKRNGIIKILHKIRNKI